MWDKIKIEKILFLDIETVPVVYNFEDLSLVMQEHWALKSKYFRNNEISAKDVYEKAGIYAEFGKIICISVAFIIREKDKEPVLRIKSFTSHNEEDLLKSFKSLVLKSFNSDDKYLCAHNGKEFDFPFIARRMLINGIKLPNILNMAGKKPWEVKHFDTLELWKFGDYKHYTSLSLLSEIFSVQSSKDDIDGSMVAKVYYEDENLERIKIYCEKDVLSLAQIFLKMRCESLIQTQNIVFVN